MKTKPVFLHLERFQNCMSVMLHLLSFLSDGKQGINGTLRLLKTQIVFLLVFFLGALSTMAQMKVPEITSEESKCVATGKVNVSGDNTYETILTGSSIPQVGPKKGFEVTFDQLPPGKYTVTQIAPSGTEATYPVTVAGNYKQNWFFDATPIFSPCANGTPTVSIGNIIIKDAAADEQRPGYFFRISTKNGSLPADGLSPPPYDTPLSGSFPIPYPAGVGGVYEIQGRDFCGNYKTLTVSVPDQIPGPSVNSEFQKFINCDGDANYEISAKGGNSPYIFSIKSGPDQPVITALNDSTAKVLLKGGGKYVVAVKNQCGGTTEETIDVKQYTAPKANMWNGYGKCDPNGGPGTGSISVNVELNTVGLGPLTVSVASASGCSQPASKQYPTDGSVSSIEFGDLVRPCTYTVTVTDGCGKTFVNEMKLEGPGKGELQCYKDLQCPDGDKAQYKLKIGVFGVNYNATPPFKIEVIDSTTNTSIANYPVFLNEFGEVYPALAKGKYYIKLTDACGATCLDSTFVPEYIRPTVSVDANNRCAGAGQANVIGINNRGPLYGWGNEYSYKIEKGPSRVGEGPESDSPPKTGQFSSLQSGKAYTFAFNDGCKTVTTEFVIPAYQQPTWEVGFGAICPPRAKADLQIVNLQPEGKVVGPYSWRIISTDSPLYGSTAPYNGTIPYPTSIGQTDSTFASLPPKDASGTAATYNIQGSDGCKNSYSGSGKVGVLPDETLKLNTLVVCPDGKGSLRARPEIPIVGATYVYFRDGIKIAQTKRLFTTLAPALPGTYTVKIYPLFETDTTCFKEASAVVTASGKLVLTTKKPELTCAKLTIDLTALTTGSSPGVITYFKNRALTQAVANPSSVTQGGTYYIQLVPDGVANCQIVDSLVVLDKCKPLGAIGNFVFVDTNKDGKQDAGETGVDGVKVYLLDGAGTKIDSTDTMGGGKYLFSNLAAGTYSVQFVKNTIPALYSGFTAKDTAGVSDALNSDADKITGQTKQVTLAPVLNPANAADSAATFNLTLDAGLILRDLCVRPKFTVMPAACATDKGTYTVSFSLTPNAGTVKVSSGTLTGTNPYTVSGVASGVNLKIIDSLGATCVFDTTIIGPNCGCPPKNPVAIAPSQTVCQGEPIPNLVVMVSTGETTDWYATQTGGPILAGGQGTLTYKPTAAGTFWVEARNIQGECSSSSRTPVTLIVNNQPSCVPFVVTGKTKK